MDLAISKHSSITDKRRENGKTMEERRKERKNERKKDELDGSSSSSTYWPGKQKATLGR